MGCIWLADIKHEWRGSVLALPAQAGGRLAITHCCCDHPIASDARQRRDTWEAARKKFRDDWARDFGEWPKEPSGTHWPGHHIHDLLHGGDPVGSKNVLPVPPTFHSAINSAYPQCYAGTGGWASAGPEYPYVD